MRAFFTLFAVGCLVSQASAQTVWTSDSVEIGPANAAGLTYANDGYYKFKTGAKSIVANDNWHLGFEMAAFPNTNVTILANHVSGKVMVYSMRRYATNSSFTSLSAADTTGYTGAASRLFNVDTSWSYGAFTANATGHPNYGWANYDGSTHDLTGDSLYLLKIGTATYKFWPQYYNSSPNDSIEYRIRIAQLNGAGDTTVRIFRRNGFAAKNFGYYNVLTNTVVDREPAAADWDMVFTRWYEAAQKQQAVSGVLVNKGTLVAKANKLNPDTVTYNNYTYSRYANTIGSNWKILDYMAQPAPVYVMDTVSYFVRPAGSYEIYQLRFKRFDYATSPATPVKYVFEKRKVADLTPPAAVAAVQSGVQGMTLAPNPAASDATVLVEMTAASNARVLVTDLTGRTLQAFPVALKNGLNAFQLQTASLPSGLYLVTVAGTDWKQTQQLAVQH